MIEVEENLQREWFLKKCDSILSKIKSPNKYRYRDIIKLRFGLCTTNNKCKTLEECAELFGVSRERIRQMEYKALGMLRGYFKKLPQDEVYFG